MPKGLSSASPNGPGDLTHPGNSSIRQFRSAICGRDDIAMRHPAATRSPTKFFLLLAIVFFVAGACTCEGGRWPLNRKDHHL